jgi:hypothetical protein
VTVHENHKKRGRPTVNDKAMTAAERQRRHRTKLKDMLPKEGEQRFRLELYRFIESYSFPSAHAVKLGEIVQSLDALSTAYRCDAFEKGKGRQENDGWMWDYYFQMLKDEECDYFQSWEVEKEDPRYFRGLVMDKEETEYLDQRYNPWG